MGDAPEEEHAQHWMALMAFDFFHPVLHRSRYQRVWLQAAASRILQRHRGDAGEAGQHLTLRLGRVVPR
jgi:hypothetical protein